MSLSSISLMSCGSMRPERVRAAERRACAHAYTSCRPTRPVLTMVRKPSGDPCSRASRPASASILPSTRRVVRRRVGERGDVPLRDDHEMHRRLRLDVVEREHVVVLVHLLRRDLAAHDLAENAVVHVSSCDRASALCRRAAQAFFVDARDAFAPLRARPARRRARGRAARAAPGSGTTGRRFRATMRSLSPSFAAMHRLGGFLADLLQDRVVALREQRAT